MGKRYSPEQREAIWSLMGSRLKPAEIRERLDFPIPARSLYEVMSRLRRDRGEPQFAVAPGQELDTAQSLIRSLLSNLVRVVQDLQDRQARGKFGPSEMALLDRAAKTALDVEKRLRDLSKDKRVNPGSEAAKPVGPSVVARLVAQERKRERAEQNDSPDGIGGAA